MKEESDGAADEIAQRLGSLQQQYAEEIDQLQRQMRVGSFHSFSLTYRMHRSIKTQCRE